MRQYKSYKFRIYPNTIQRELFEKTFGSVRFVYNYYLEYEIKAYEDYKKYVSYVDCTKDLVNLKSNYSFLKEVDIIALRQSLKHLDIAFKNFFRKKTFGYPKFKSKKNEVQSYSTLCSNNSIRLDHGSLHLPKIKSIKIKQHRPIPEEYKVKSVTISKTASNKYYASILFEFEAYIKPIEPTKTLGMDYSMKELFVASDALQTDKIYLKFYKRSENKLSKEQRKLSLMKIRSNNYYKQKQRVAKFHEKVSNQRKDYLHKLSYQIANDYDLVCIEDLNMKDMAQTLHFGKSVVDNSWGMFSSFLAYKLTDRGKALQKVAKMYPSSKTCHKCGYINNDLKLSDRFWSCLNCGTFHDRDKNASYNIETEGLRLYSA